MTFTVFLFSSTRPDPSMVTTIFQVTPLMSTYLIAFVISDFNFITNRNIREPSELLQNVYGQPNAIANGEADFALEAGIKIMKKMEEYFGFPYTLPKMDQIGIPDFSAGAMENWGLVTYNEMYLYYDNGTSPFQQLDWVASIVAHEYAHQWFGNLIALRWWDVLWMNEGFATLYEFMSTDTVFPEWRMHDMMVVNILQTVFNRDASESTRPMTYYLESQNEVERLFDFVAYDKCEQEAKVNPYFQLIFQNNFSGMCPANDSTCIDRCNICGRTQQLLRRHVKIIVFSNFFVSL
jgi:aminopeptidase N